MDDVRMSETSHKHEFTIKNVQPEDAGVYECSGRNIVVEKPEKQNFTLIVKCNITFSCPFPFFKQKKSFHIKLSLITWCPVLADLLDRLNNLVCKGSIMPSIFFWTLQNIRLKLLSATSGFKIYQLHSSWVNEALGGFFFFVYFIY